MPTWDNPLITLSPIDQYTNTKLHYIDIPNATNQGELFRDTLRYGCIIHDTIIDLNAIMNIAPTLLATPNPQVELYNFKEAHKRALIEIKNQRDTNPHPVDYPHKVNYRVPFPLFTHMEDDNKADVAAKKKAGDSYYTSITTPSEETNLQNVKLTLDYLMLFTRLSEDEHEAFMKKWKSSGSSHFELPIDRFFPLHELKSRLEWCITAFDLSTEASQESTKLAALALRKMIEWCSNAAAVPSDSVTTAEAEKSEIGNFHY